jgi:beta-lactamase regulating signal transducer with metallopeptidase domain
MIMLVWSLKVFLILAIGLSLVFLLRRQSAALRHWLLSMTIVGAALAPALSLVIPALDVRWTGSVPLLPVVAGHEGIPASNPTPPVPSYAAPPPTPVVRGTEHAPVSAIPSPDEYTASRESVAVERDSDAVALPLTTIAVQASPAIADRAVHRQTPLLYLLGGIWIVGILFGFAALALGLARLAWIASKSQPVNDASWQAAADTISREYKLRRRPRLLRTSRSILATWGVRRPDVLLPIGSESWTEERIRIVLSHELAHVRRGDWLIQLLAEMVRAFYWFNPLTWAACRLLDRDSEHACDDAVIERGVRREDYIAQLIELARELHSKNRRLAPALMMARKVTLERRFRALSDYRLKHGRLTRSSIAMTTVAIVAISLPIVAFRLSATPPPVSHAIGTLAHLAASTTIESLTSPEPVMEPLQAGTTGTLIEGRVLKFGTRDPVSRASVELRRIECGEAAIPAEVYTALTGRSLPYWTPAPDAKAAPEVFTLMTGDDGRFSFPKLSAGSYCLVAYRGGAGFTSAEYEQRGLRGRGVTIHLTEGQQLRDITLALPATGSIVGRVFDASGEPVAHAQVQALEPTYFEGRRRLNIVTQLQTDDLGAFRLYWLPPGRYYIAATLEDPERRTVHFATYPGGRAGRLEVLTYPVTTSRDLDNGNVLEETYTYAYYGGGTDPRRATPVDLAPGAIVGGIDIPLGDAKQRSFHVRGNVTNQATGQPVANASVRLLPPDWVPNVIAPSAVSDATGMFDIAGVIPGSYMVYATGRNTTGRGAAGGIGARITFDAIPAPEISTRTFVTVNGADANDIKLSLAAGYDIRGRITMEGWTAAEAASAVTSIRVRPIRDPDTFGQPAPVLRDTSPAAPDGAFTVTGIGPGDYRLVIEPVQIHPVLILPPPPAPPALQDAYVKSIRLSAADVFAGGLHIAGAPEGTLEVVVAKGGRVRGRVMDSRQQAAVNATVVLISESAATGRTDRSRFGRTDTSGQFLLQGIPPGEYRMYAWQEIEDGVWLDPEFIRPYQPRGRLVRVDQGQSVTMDISVIPK